MTDPVETTSSSDASAPRASDSEDEALLALEDLSVSTAEGRPIIAPSTVELHEGDVCLLVGMSGSGKSLLTNLILGTLPPESNTLELDGAIRFDGVDLLQWRPDSVREKMGAVFQLHRIGLFDGLTVDENLAFNASGDERRSEVAAKWRRKLDLQEAPDDLSLTSGGQRQRIALARTLERHPGVLIYDEPTTGLDPRAQSVTVDLIRAHHQRLTLIVTHDYASFLPIADRVLWIDPIDHRLREITDEEAIPDFIQDRCQAAAEEAAEEEKGRRRSFLRRLWGGYEEVALTADRIFRSGLALFTAPVFLYRLLDWRIRKQFAGYLARFFKPGTGVYIGTAAFLAGLVATFFLFDRLPMRSYTEDLITDELLRSLGFALVRIIGPLLTAILVAAKLGASVTATLSNMSYTRQVDALILFDVKPRYYLLWPVICAFVLGTSALTVVGIGAASLTSAAVFIYHHPGMTPLFWWQHFTSALTWGNVGWVAAKTVLCALGTAIIAYDSGVTPKRSSDDMGNAIHRTILWSLIWVLFVHAGFSFVEF